MRRMPWVGLILCCSLLILPRRLASQAPAFGGARPLVRRISALRLQAMLQPSFVTAPVPSGPRLPYADPLPPLSTPAIRFTGRSLRLSLAGPLDLRAGVSWWSTGLRSSAGFALRF